MKISDHSLPQERAEKVLENLIKITAPQVMGTHDAHMTIVDGKAYIVYEANDVKASESAEWTFIYCAMSIVDIKSNKVEKIIKFAESEQAFCNEKLPVGCCFVPRIIQKDDSSLRVFFASEHPHKRQSLIWYIDYDIRRQEFDKNIYKIKIETEFGIFDMQPKYFYEQAKAHGFNKPEVDFGFYLFELGKKTDGKHYVVLNNFINKQNALGILNDAFDTVKVLGNFNEPEELELSESAVNKLPNGRWMAIIRNDNANQNYCFSESDDGIVWSAAKEMAFVVNGSNSKPTFDKFGDKYYLGWQEKPGRTKFNIDTSKDCVTWNREFSFYTPDDSFQYPELFEYDGVIYICVTQGNKERIMFGSIN